MTISNDVPVDSSPGKKRAKIENWWAAVWRGLVVDQNGKHYRNINSALWLYIYLLIHARRETGLLFQGYTTIATAMGVSERTIRNWMGRLKKHDYVSIANNGRTRVINITKWKPWGQLKVSRKK